VAARRSRRRTRRSGAITRRDDIRDDRLRAHHETTTAESLERAKENQLQHGVCDAAQHAADQEEDDGRLEVDLATVQVTQLAQSGVLTVEESRYATTTQLR